MKRLFAPSFLFCLVLAVGLELRGQATDPVQTAAYIQLRTPEPIAWGEPVDGLNVGIGAIRAFHGEKKDLIISAYLANRGSGDLPWIIRSSAEFVIEVDGHFYGEPSFGGPAGAFPPGKVFPAILLIGDRYREIAGPDRNVINGSEAAPLGIGNGPHSVRIHYRLSRPDARKVVPSALVNIEVPADRADLKATVAALAELAGRSDPLGREQELAIEGLRHLPGEEAIAGIAPCLKDRDSSVRSLAARSLGELKLKSAIPFLTQTLSDSDYGVRVSAAHALGAIGDRSAIAPLKTRHDDPNVTVRFEVLSALVALGEPVDLPRVSEIIRTKAGNEFQSAIWLVRRNAPTEAVRTLMACLDFSDASVASYYNYTLVWQIGACDGPKFAYHHDFDGKGTAAEVAENQRILDAMRAALPSP